MAEFPSEPFVKESVRKYLEDQKYPAVIKEFAIERGKIDFVAYKWREGGYGIQYFVVECKDSHDLEVKTFIDIIQDQVSRYQDIFPDVYLAIPKPSAEGFEKQVYVRLCKVHRVGLLIVSEEGKIEERIDPERPAPIEIQDRMAGIDSFSAAVLGFLELFEEQPKRGPNPTWISTGGALQYNLWYDEDQIRFGVNAEDAKDLRVEVSRNLLEGLSSKASESLEVVVRKEKYTRPHKRSFFVVLKKPFRALGTEDFGYIAGLVSGSASGRYNVHLIFTIPLWTTGQVYGKREATERIKFARDSLQWLFEGLCS